MPGKHDGTGPIIYGPPRVPRIAKKCKFLYIVAHIWKTGIYFVPLFNIYICLLCDEVLLSWKFSSPGFDIRAPRTPPPKYEKKYIFLSYFGFKLKKKNSYHIVSLFDMYMDMGERIAGKQDRASLIIEDPLRAP